MDTRPLPLTKRLSRSSPVTKLTFIKSGRFLNCLWKRHSVQVTVQQPPSRFRFPIARPPDHNPADDLVSVTA